MNLIKSTSTFSLFVLLSRVLGYIRDFFIAIYLGSGPLADAFFVAFRIPNTFRRLFSEGTFNAAFVPSYSSELVSGKKKSNKFANEVFNLLFLILLILVLIIQLFMPLFVSLIAPGFTDDNEKMSLAITLTRITFPFLILISLASFFGAILNSHNRFAEAAAAPIILNIILILILFLSKTLNDELIYYLSFGVTISGVLQLIFLYYFARKYFDLRFNIQFEISKKVKLFFNKLLPSIFSSGVTQINILIGTIIASFQASAVSYLYYADRIYQINLAVAGIAIGIGNYAGHPHKHVEGGYSGYLNRLHNIQNVSAVTGAMMMVKRELYNSVEGFDERLFKIACNDVDFCLRLRSQGLLNIFTPYARAYHHESVSRGYEDTPEKKARFDKEVDAFRNRHGESLSQGDPYYNRHFRLDTEEVLARPWSET